MNSLASFGFFEYFMTQLVHAGSPLNRPAGPAGKWPWLVPL
jgi:hypothetical protein